MVPAHPLRVGLQLAGSEPTPAVHCKYPVPTIALLGWLRRAGIVPRSLTQDRAGPLGRSVYDVAAMMDAMAGFDPDDLDTRVGLGHYLQGGWAEQVAVPDLKKFRIGV